jgi:hypothetical protein
MTVTQQAMQRIPPCQAKPGLGVSRLARNSTARVRWPLPVRGASSLAQMGDVLAAVPLRVGYQLALGVVTFPVQVSRDAWESGTAAREYSAGERGGWDVVWHAATLAGDVYTIYGTGTGREYKLDRNHRVAPFGNRTGNPYGELSHYHRRVTDSTGATTLGQGIGRHRPWDTRSPDTSFWNRC